jgi:hypothetical protein
MCACPGDTLTFDCTIMGGGATIWRGSAFDCTSNEIVLRHANFVPRTSESCNGGNIVGESMGVSGICYSSRLIVTITSDLNGQTVGCYGNSNGSMIQIGESRLSILAGNLLCLQLLTLYMYVSNPT